MIASPLFHVRHSLHVDSVGAQNVLQVCPVGAEMYSVTIARIVIL